ncbi:MAG TPA: amidohydrolase [Syntrophomonadaceae bacterium]|nr:amidohydrolase [Syntrophomonadaceae bacterium]
MERILIQNGLVLDMTGSEPKPARNSILIEGNRIAQIGEVPCTDDMVVIDASGKVVMPGLINCHNHAYMSLLRGYCDDLRLFEWLSEKMWPAEDKMKGEDVYWGTMLGCAEMIKSGTTTFADMSFFMDEVAGAVQDSGIRASLAQGLLFLDDDVNRRIDATYKLFSQWRGKANGRISTMVGPHAPQTCPPDKIKLAMELARELDSAIHIHLAETTEEVEQIAAQYGKTPTQYLADLGLFDEFHVLLAHAVHISRDDINRLRNLKGGISHNPVSNQKLGCGISPVLELIREGINVALGTDGPASTVTLDMFEEIKAAAWMHKNAYLDPTALNAYQVLRMATINGALALGVDNEIGTIEVGKKADLIFVDIEKPHLYPHHDICALLAYSANGGDVDTVMIDGKIVMQNCRLLTMDERLVLREAERCAARITS